MQQIAMSDDKAIISSAYDGAIRWAIGTQLIVGFLAALLLDGGVTARVVGVAVLGFWLSAAIVIVRRPFAPSKLDIALVHWGFWPMLAFTGLRQIFL